MFIVYNSRIPLFFSFLVPFTSLFKEKIKKNGDESSSVLFKFYILRIELKKMNESILNPKSTTFSSYFSIDAVDAFDAADDVDDVDDDADEEEGNVFKCVI